MPFWSVREVLAESGAERPGLQGRCLEAGWAESKRDEGSCDRKEKLRLEPESNNNALEKYLMMADAVRIARGGVSKGGFIVLFFLAREGIKGPQEGFGKYPACRQKEATQNRSKGHPTGPKKPWIPRIPKQIRSTR
jgi:hypothetical protein